MTMAIMIMSTMTMTMKMRTTRIVHRMTKMTSTTTATTTTRRRRRRQHDLPSHRQATGDIEANVDIVCTKSHTDDIAAAQYAQE